MLNTSEELSFHKPENSEIQGIIEQNALSQVKDVTSKQPMLESSDSNAGNIVEK